MRFRIAAIHGVILAINILSPLRCGTRNVRPLLPDPDAPDSRPVAEGGAAVTVMSCRQASAPSATVAQLLQQARQWVPEAGEAEWLLAHVLKRSRSWLYVHDHEWVDADTHAHYADLLRRRVQGEPIAYLTGQRGFWALDLDVTADTLIPRVETELLVEAALERIPEDAAWRLADLGTGSGAVALAIAHERGQCSVLAVDVSAAALAVAQRNADRNDIRNVRFTQGDWYAPLQGERMHVLVSNPPYIADTDPHLQRGDLRFEPALALASGADGLDAIRAIAAGALLHLLPGGWLLVEHGCSQGQAVRDIFEACGLQRVLTLRDLEGRERVTVGQAPGTEVLPTQSLPGSTE